ncbi:MAG: EamA family transporter, partial [Deltaproteobacteria bacterium]|nr:EamA family transporter [Deltaproteobacteria bacterium]
MPVLALSAVLLAALTHATWNLAAKRAAEARHFVWLYSALSIALYAPIVAGIVVTTRPVFGWPHWLALAGTATLHMAYSLALQTGYRVSDLSLVYPIARGSGPLISFALAALLLGESVTRLSALGMAAIVVGIALVSGMLDAEHRAPRAGIAYGLLTGALIASYTVNDGYAVKTLLISPFIVEYSGNLVRALVLAPRAWLDRSALRDEWHTHRRSVTIVSLLGPLGYVLILFAMQLAPVSHVAPARELSTLFGAYLGSRVLRERAAP